MHSPVDCSPHWLKVCNNLKEEQPITVAEQGVFQGVFNSTRLQASVLDSAANSSVATGCPKGS